MNAINLIDGIDGNMSISIYPNPTAAILNVKFDKDLELTIYNLLGQQVLQSNSKTLDFPIAQAFAFSITCG